MNKVDILIEYLGLNELYLPPCGLYYNSIFHCDNCIDYEKCRKEWDVRIELRKMEANDG